MENKFDPKAKVKQGDLGSAADGKQPNQEPTNIDFNKHAPTQGKSKNCFFCISGKDASIA